MNVSVSIAFHGIATTATCISLHARSTSFSTRLHYQSNIGGVWASHRIYQGLKPDNFSEYQDSHWVTCTTPFQYLGELVMCIRSFYETRENASHTKY
jgi:hypothetical protein